MMWGSSVVLVALFSFHLSYHEAEALDKDCLTAMSKMMDNNKKLIVPCIEKMGLSTGAEKKEKALVFKNQFNLSFSFQDLIKLELRLRIPTPKEALVGMFHKIKNLKADIISFFQCIMKCVMIEGKMLGADGNVDMELAQKILEDLPDALKERAGDVIQECGHHAAGFDPAEASCESYREFVSCMLDVSMKMCN